MSITATIKNLIAEHDIYETKTRDKYGRGMVEYTMTDRKTNTRSHVVLVSLPKMYTEKYGDVALVNNHSKRHYEETSHWHFPNRNDAKLFAINELVASQQKKLAAL
ncbi:hypothetical protein SEA_JKERNS_76 [Arthrobacter phage JKerns]|uniref:Uncharacterized protein n=2 Tax=Marthavirus TaxID=1980936 RepID=A0A0U3TMQ3_9CAUD|nr:hypothetical protein FDH50_gp77 [Arthrobacter phage Sonny]ALY10345.1 hypothetical protein SONNY_77 [Arthrobacter phage Sonny]ASR80631.1 hypothetical protein SEA_JORDAN_78 [Arthrobacter phage Jordan]QIQ62888.1 hypothetical protein SEA_JKERNS_76 [Arthrobacter phage JKerns]